MDAISTRKIDEKMIYLDTNVFIYILDKNAEKRFRNISRKILKRIEKDEVAITSFISLMEVLWWCEKNLKDKIKEVYDMIMSYKNLKIINIFSDMFDDALFFKIKYGLELNDCIALAVMVKSEIDEIYSNDTGFDKVDWIKRIFK